ncbi:hypothetical protein QBC43DRAFT_320878 [Cladorrhinum sp. PSN259]|nr:hypothetical protein QBC43DRAFT_320878 [Cladorrhinum sp. PSN259]
MTLTSRLSLTGPDPEDPEDFLSASLGVIFPDDVANQHGDTDHGLLYTSPHLPTPLQFSLAQVSAEKDRHLFSHYLWNSSLLLAELIESGTLGIKGSSSLSENEKEFDVTGLTTIELGAGTALPSIMSGLLGAKRVVVTDYPTPPVINTLKENVTSLIKSENAPAGKYAVEEVKVDGHAWGEFDDEDGEDGARLLAGEYKHGFDRVYAADCLWMPWQHDNLRKSIAWFIGEGHNSRAWVVAGFHTGRDKMAPFFNAEKLREVGLEVEKIWERDCNGVDREWVEDRGVEDVRERKRWLVVAVLKRIPKERRVSSAR